MIREALEQFAKANQRTFTHDRSLTVGASEIGQCARKTFWVKRESDPVLRAARDEGFIEGWGARTRGTVMEESFWEPALRAAYGDALKYAGKDQVTLSKGHLSATPDGILWGDTSQEWIVLECKSIDPRAHLPEAKPEHVYQAQVQMGLFNETTQYKPKRAIISYTNSSFWNEVREFDVAFDPKIYENAKSRATKIMTAFDAGELRAEGWIAGGQECEFCPFVQACGKIRRGPSVPDNAKISDPQFIAEIADLARQYEYARGAADLAQKQVREASDEIKTRLAQKQVRRIDGDGVRVTWSIIKGRDQVNTKKLAEAAEAAGVDTAPFFSQADPSDRLTVTVSSKQETAA